MTTPASTYAARLDIDYPDRDLDRVSTLFRLIWIIPIAVLGGILSASATVSTRIVTETGETVSQVSETTGGIGAGLAAATALMIVFRQKYPRWWFDFAREFARFTMRIGAYFALLTDEYPSTDEEQSVHLELDYPDVEQDLNQWMPLVKWLLAIPHYIVLLFLSIGAFFAVVVAWFAILFTGRYPRAIFDYVVGVARWALRVEAYMALLITDEYPPFSLQ